MTITDFGISGENHHHGDHHSVTAFGKLEDCARCKYGAAAYKQQYQSLKTKCNAANRVRFFNRRNCLVDELKLKPGDPTTCQTQCNEGQLKNRWTSGMSEDTLTSIVRLRHQRMHRLVDFL